VFVSRDGSLDDEVGVEGHRGGDVVAVGGEVPGHLVDLPELLLGAVALVVDGLLERLVARRDAGVDAEKAAQVDITLGLDAHRLELGAWHSLVPKTYLYNQHHHLHGERHLHLRHHCIHPSKIPAVW
jgi:hypothetical protein